MRRWWVAVCVGRHVYAWWPFDRRTLHDLSANSGVGVLSGMSDRVPASRAEDRDA